MRKGNTMKATRNPLGYISLLNHIQKPVYPMDDFFINYAFYKKENWKHLRKVLNIILHAYAVKYNRYDGYHYIDENIIVETQYEHYLKNTTKHKTQDMKVDEVKNDDLTYVEFQNRIQSKPPISIRASQYNGLAINKAKEGAKVSQIWLLGENDDNVLCKQAISNFRMKEENTGDYYPSEVNIMFVSLPRLAEEDNICGELAKFLMGANLDHVSDELEPIIKMFKQEYEIFKQNEEVIKSMTILEERYEEGINIGEARAFEKLLIKKIRNGENYNKLRTLAIDIGVNIERLEELIKESLPSG